MSPSVAPAAHARSGLLEPVRAAIDEALELRNSDPKAACAKARQALDSLDQLQAEPGAAERDPVAAGLRAAAHAALGHAARLASDLPLAAAECRLAAAEYARLGDAAGEATACTQWGIALVQLGDLSGGMQRFERALACARQAGNRQRECDALIDLGVVHNMLGDDAQAIALYEQARPVFRALGDRYHEGTCLNNAAWAALCWGRRLAERGDEAGARAQFERARRWAEQALPLAESCDHVDFVASCLDTQGQILRALGAHEEALALLERQTALSDQLAGERMRPVGLAARADLLLAQAAAAEAAAAAQLRRSARALLEEADALCERLALREPQEPVLASLALACEALGDWQAALAATKRRYELALELKSAAAERDARTLAARMQAERMQAELDAARAREEALAALNAQLRAREQELARLARSDALTGLLNRRAWLQQAGEAAAAAAARGGSAQGQRAHVALIDLDHFKTVNDRYGHAQGDAVLLRVARLLAPEALAACGIDGFAARWGGEEFALWLSPCAAAQAAAALERWLDALRAERPEAHGAALRLTASIGLAGLDPASADTLDAALARADACLYRAKAAGRDRLVAAAG
jgi:diguanylate cyclase (GGDEF)-like protein